ncbi:MAG: glycosyltransferase family 4 protein [Candidatus Magasanikbacteria bacterium]|jgi:glycosyltransferase involved in cell wall biosynthesis|nr:glycosyltransferase family 4 protein [Candidatus Magasanikbacteria bacterium]
MKVLYLTTVRVGNKGAQSLQVQHMCNAFYHRLKKDFLLVSAHRTHICTLNTPYPSKFLSIPLWLPRIFQYVALLVLSFGCVKRFKPDVIYSRDIGVVLVYGFLGYRTVYEAHKHMTTVLGNMCLFFLRKKSRIVTNCDALKQLFISRYHIPNTHIVAAHNGIDPKWIGGVEEKEKIRKKYFDISNPDQKIIIYSGSGQKGKGVDVVIAFARALPEYRFFLFHHEGMYDAITMPQNISFLGEHTHAEVMSFIKAADVLLLPNTAASLEYSLYTSPLKMFEYMVSGVPIVASRIGSIIEVLNERNAYLFDPNDIAEGIFHIRTICQNSIVAAQKSQQALTDVRQYTWDTRVQAILTFLQ